MKTISHFRHTKHTSGWARSTTKERFMTSKPQLSTTPAHTPPRPCSRLLLAAGRMQEQPPYPNPATGRKPKDAEPRF